MNRTLKWGPIGGCESPHSKRGEEAFSHARQASQGLFCGEERQSWAKPDAYPDVLTCLCLSWPGWRNWQTQRTQNPPRFTPRGGSTPPPGTNRTPHQSGFDSPPLLLPAGFFSNGVVVWTLIRTL